MSREILPPLQIRKRLPAPRERVFEYWTDPDQIRIWLGGPEVDVPHVSIDLREAGSYEYHLINPDGSESKIMGDFHTVEPPERLVFSWYIVNDAGRSPTTKVTIQFNAVAQETEIVLLHEGFLEEPSRDLHEDGWLGCLSTLDSMLA